MKVAELKMTEEGRGMERRDFNGRFLFKKELKT